MKIGATKRILINFNPAVLPNIASSSVLSLTAFLFVENRVLLKFSKDNSPGFDGVIENNPVSPNVGIIRLTHELSQRLIPGRLLMEVWLAKSAPLGPEHYESTVYLTRVEPSMK